MIRASIERDWSLEQVLHHQGHTDIVRGCKLDINAGTAVSCGEDGQICLWSVPPSTSSEESPLPSARLKVSLELEW